MASRADIKDAFYTELSDAAATTHTVTYGDGSTSTVTVDASNVDLISPDALEDLPSVIFDEDYVRREYNGVGKGPHEIIRDQNDDVTTHVYREYITGIFTVMVEAADEMDKEPIYESIHRAFGKYTFGPWPEHTFQDDVTDIRIETVDSSDFGAEDETIRADTLSIQIDFHRDYDQTGTAIQTVDLTTDADTDDGTAGDSYTIN